MQAGGIDLVAVAMGTAVRHDPAAVVAVRGTVRLGSAVFSTFSSIVACIVKTRERLMAVGQVLAPPLAAVRRHPALVR